MEARLTIRGRVQGVFFRADGREEALRRKLTGWIKNEPDGSVSVCVQGPRARIEDFIQWCRKGPPSARVESVNIEWAEALYEKYEDFEVRF